MESLKFDDIIDSDEDVIGERTIKVGEYSYKLKLKNPHTHWEIFNDTGGLPPMELRGVFTSKRAAMDALTKYVARKSNEGSIAKKHKEALGPSFDKRAELFDESTTKKKSVKKEV